MGTTDRRVELHVRSLASRTGDSVRERAIGLLGRLEAEGEIASFAVRVWGERVGLSTSAVGTDRGQEVLERIGAFRAWAGRNGASLDPFFRSGAADSRLTGEEYATLRLPVAVLAEYEGDSLVHVTPHERDEVVHTVDDRLDTIEGGTDPELEPLSTN